MYGCENMNLEELINELDKKVNKAKEELLKAYIEKIRVLTSKLKEQVPEIKSMTIVVDDQSEDLETSIYVDLTTGEREVDIYDIPKLNDIARRIVTEIDNTASTMARMFLLEKIPERLFNEPIPTRFKFLSELEEE